MSIEQNKLKNIIEAALMAVAKPMTIEQLMQLFGDEYRPSSNEIKDALAILVNESETRGVELKEVASGFRYQAKQEYSEWLSRLWEERPAKYSRAALETLALIAYRQPVTRAEIEDVRGVGVSSSIVKTMIEREWIRVVGHRDVPGRPALYATTKQFLDYFNMKSLDELPTLAEIKDLEDLNPELDLPNPDEERETRGGKDKAAPSNEENSEVSDSTELESTELDLNRASNEAISLEDGDVASGIAPQSFQETDEHLQTSAFGQTDESLEVEEVDVTDSNQEQDELSDIHTESNSDSFYAEHTEEGDGSLEQSED
ncbi:MAG: SMC-Scp complex subunit ScpB [Kangiellaceae bacterium]|nr:SMC-Scp complex subunit ScpB [Kangiellaceae bacterium]